MTPYCSWLLYFTKLLELKVLLIQPMEGLIILRFIYVIDCTPTRNGLELWTYNKKLWLLLDDQSSCSCLLIVFQSSHSTIPSVMCSHLFQTCHTLSDCSPLVSSSRFQMWWRSLMPTTFSLFICPYPRMSANMSLLTAKAFISTNLRRTTYALDQVKRPKIYFSTFWRDLGSYFGLHVQPREWL